MLARWPSCGHVGGHARTLEDDEAVATGILAAAEGGEAVPRVDRELAAEIGDLVDDRPVVARVGHEEDRPLRSEVALLGTQPPLDGLNVIEAGFGFDDGLERSRVGHRIGAAQDTWERHGHLGPPPNRGMESCSESTKQGELPLVPYGCTDRMNTHAQLVSEYRCHPLENLDVHARCEPALDTECVRMGDTGKTTQFS
jgi:hypothetical protein